MYNIEILEGGNWLPASSHTQLIDRDAQYQRLLDNGFTAEVLRFTQD